MTQPQELYCKTCGGTNVTSFADCGWDVVTQSFSFFDVRSEDDYCADCEDRATGEFRPITDLKTLAQIAIKQEEANEARA